MKRIQLTSAEKLRQMNEKYSGADLKSVTNKAKSKIDIYYIKNASILLDLKILFGTLYIIVIRAGN